MKSQESNEFERAEISIRGEAIKKTLNALGYETPDATDFFKGIQEYYVKPSIADVVTEELLQIAEHDPNFLKNQGIILPDNLESYISNLYLDSHGEKGVKSVIYSAKVIFRHIRFFLVTNPDEEELTHTITEFKKLLEGNYLKT